MILILLIVCCLSAFILTLTSRSRSTPSSERANHPLLRREGIAFICAVLAASLAGLLIQTFFASHAAAPAASGTTSALGQAKLAVNLKTSSVLLLTAILYVVSVVREARRLPPWVADLCILLAAGSAIYIFGQPVVQTLRLPFTNQYVGLGAWAAPLTMFWVWVIARMTAALNRTPQVTGGYLGIVSLTLLLLAPFSAQSTPFFTLAACAALVGAGLASVPLALRLPGFNLGWSTAVAMGFLLAQVTTIGLFKNMAFAILTLLLLVFGLPVLDVSFYNLRAARRGQKVTWEEHKLRLHEVLQRRGISPAKVSLLYLTIAASLCALGVIVVATARWNLVLRIGFIGIILFCGAVLFLSLTRVLMRRTADEQIPEEVEAFGVRISPVSMSEALDKIEGFIRDRKPHHVVTSDANAILRAQEDTEYADIIRRAALITPDGFGVIWGARLLNLPIYERVTGVDMVTGICERAAANGYSIYILGAAPGIAATAAQKLMEKYPGMRVAGTQHGYFKPEEEDEVVRTIHNARPDVLFVAFGIPKQEKFIARHLHELNVPVSLGVGGSFDVYSEKLKRAPEYIQRSGMEWLYRVWQEPWRWKRMSYVPRFMVFALREWLTGTKRSRNNDKQINKAQPSKAAP
jgi:N-acetylglucosaminyldiphosphoundecaprenol N-acetyl-beta-D-mannosaminyltransferase